MIIFFDNINVKLGSSIQGFTKEGDEVKWVVTKNEEIIMISQAYFRNYPKVIEIHVGYICKKAENTIESLLSPSVSESFMVELVTNLAQKWKAKMDKFDSSSR